MELIYFPLAIIGALVLIFIYALRQAKTEPERRETKQMKEMIQNETDLKKIIAWRNELGKKYHEDLEKVAQRAFDKEFKLIEYTDLDKMAQLHEKIKDYNGIAECKKKISDEIKHTIEFRLSKIEAKSFTYPEKVTKDEINELNKFRASALLIKELPLIERIDKVIKSLDSKKEIPQTMQESLKERLQETS